MTNPKRTLLAFVALASVALAAGQTPPPRRLSTVDIVLPGYYDHLKERNEDVEAGVAAEKRGDYAAAEAAYRRACTAMGWEEPFEHLHPARLFDRTGDARKAYAEYRIVVVGNKNSFSTQQRNPNILAHFGDLCLRYGTVDDAQEAYRLAIANGSLGFSPQTLTATARNDAFYVVRSAAHTASAIEYQYHGQPKECLAELELAVRLDDQNCTARIYRARAYKAAGRKADATREAMIAERMVSGKDREAVRAMRLFYRIPDEKGQLPPEPSPGKPNSTYNVTRPVGSPP